MGDRWARTPSWTYQPVSISMKPEWIIRNSPVPIGTVPIYQAQKKWMALPKT